MFIPYIDLHSHTTRSDGSLTPKELVKQAREAGIRFFSITDHNYTENLDDLRKNFPDMTLIQGAEISCIYSDSSEKEHELHIVALGFDPENKAMQALLARNQPDRRPYINAILDRLRENGIDLGNYEDIQKRFPNTQFIGRMILARCLFDEGYTASVDQSFDIYLGAHGQRRAYVKFNLQYATLEETVRTILEAGGIPVLAHLKYFRLDNLEEERLVNYFKEITGNRGAMEVYYSRYNEQTRLYLLSLSQKYNLMVSAASDYHGQEQWERLDTGFPYTACSELLDCLGIQMPNTVPTSEMRLIDGLGGVGRRTIDKEIITTDEKTISVIRSIATLPSCLEEDE